jgi:hypothetical protein
MKRLALKVLMTSHLIFTTCWTEFIKNSSYYIRQNFLRLSYSLLGHVAVQFGN